MTSNSPRHNALLICALVLVALRQAASAQIASQIVVYGKSSSNADLIARFDEELSVLGATPTAPAGGGFLDITGNASVDGSGRFWVPFDALNDKKVLRMTGSGSLILPSIALPFNAVFTAPSSNGTVYVLTRVPLSLAGPLFALSPTGSVLWSNPEGPSLFEFYPQNLLVTPSGTLWIGGSKVVSTVPYSDQPLLIQVDPGSGAVMQQDVFPNPPGSGTGTGFGIMAASPDGTLWGLMSQTMTQIELAHTSIVKQFSTEGGWNGATGQLRTDAKGNVLIVDKATQPEWGARILHYDGNTGELVATYNLGDGDNVHGFALGPSGEDLFGVSTNQLTPPFARRLVRLNLVTGVRSRMPMNPIDKSWELPNGDPTGFNWANVINQDGDADVDGFSNRSETLAGTNPFDATSRPGGPKVYLSFAPVTNALLLTFKDPDGLIDPQKGLDPRSFSVTIGNYGNVFNILLAFATGLDLNSDFTEATVTFGALPLPNNKKWKVEARVADLTGAVGWDWQVTPPGDL
jgi:hypothetical protein